MTTQTPRVVAPVCASYAVLSLCCYEFARGKQTTKCFTLIIKRRHHRRRRRKLSRASNLKHALNLTKSKACTTEADQ